MRKMSFRLEFYLIQGRFLQESSDIKNSNYDVNSLSDILMVSIMFTEFTKVTKFWLQLASTDLSKMHNNRIILFFIETGKFMRIHQECVGWIEKSFQRITDTISQDDVTLT